MTGRNRILGRTLYINKIRGLSKNDTHSSRGPRATKIGATLIEHLHEAGNPILTEFGKLAA